MQKLQPDFRMRDDVAGSPIGLESVKTARTFTASGPAGLSSNSDKLPFHVSGFYLARQAAVESNARAYPRRLPITIARGRGVKVWDVDGREYIDCLAGAGAIALGHSHPVVVDAIRDALDAETVLQTLDLPTPLKDRFIGDLFSTLPPAIAHDFKIHFCGPTGSDAVEAALKLARVATGRRGIMSFRGAYHGMTTGALMLTGESAARAAIGGVAGEVQVLPFPSDYRCPFGVGGEAGAELGLRYLESLLDDANSGISQPAAIIIEPVQGEGGVHPAPDHWLRGLREITAERGIVLILDEVQSGLGRTGRLYAFEHAGLTPDVIVLSKAIGGGLPLSVILYRRELDLWQTGVHAGTFRGNQLAFAAGGETIRYVLKHDLARHAAIMGERLQSSLETIAAQTRCIGDVRGRGLMRGVEIIDASLARDTRSAGPPPPSKLLARRIQDECLQRGLILELGGRSSAVVRFLPPLIVNDAEIDEIVGRFAEAVVAAERATAAAQ